ncbi:hypothetical protein [Clostridium polynesiense]|uniref:hypothetical protein n=1 Tax=Clostridium polynesiense TaxID=1325933 RepID=UPI001FA7A738|nr:hypothetical protein [Clostridium polynesiense]
MAIIRDFSLDAVNELRGIIKKSVDEEDQFFLFDWFQDTFQMEDLDIKNYIDNVEEYHSHIVDKHNIDGEKFERILKRVHAVDINYANRLSSISECMVAFNEKIMDVADMINPSVITLEGTYYNKLSTEVKDNYSSAVLSMINNIDGLQEQMPELRDIAWYESALSAVGGFGVSLLRDSVEGIAFLPYAIIDEKFNTRLNENLNSILDGLEEKYISPLVTDEKWYYRGRATGDAACIVIGSAGIVIGFLTLASGITIGATGVATTSTGIGVILGSIEIAVSVPIVFVGAAQLSASRGIYDTSKKNYKNNLEKLNSSKRVDLDDVDLGKEAEKLKDGISKSDSIIDGIKVTDGKVNGKIPVDEFKNIREESIQNINSDTITLGKYKPMAKADGTLDWTIPGKDSYTVMAGDTTYFSLGNDWDIIKGKYNVTDDDMFDLFNVPALNDAVKAGKEIRFSHNPTAYGDCALKKEWQYLKDKFGYTRLKKIGDFWYAK